MNHREGKHRNDQSKLVKGIIAGMAGGLIASWTMNEFQSLLSKIAEAGKKSQDNEEAQNSQGNGKEDSEPATVKAASAISENIFNHPLTENEKEIAGSAVHYAFGMLAGGLYGAAAEFSRPVSTGAGLPFGVWLWLVADEAAVSALGFAKAPAQEPLSKHAFGLSSHLIYGLTADGMRRIVRRML